VGLAGDADGFAAAQFRGSLFRTSAYQDVALVDEELDARSADTWPGAESRREISAENVAGFGIAVKLDNFALIRGIEFG